MTKSIAPEVFFKIGCVLAKQILAQIHLKSEECILIEMTKLGAKLLIRSVRIYG